MSHLASVAFGAGCLRSPENPGEPSGICGLFAPAQRSAGGDLLSCRLDGDTSSNEANGHRSQHDVDEIMRRWPATIRVFIRNRMLCIGCPIGIFHTAKDAGEVHDLDEETFSRELPAAMRDDDRAKAPSANRGPDWRQTTEAGKKSAWRSTVPVDVTRFLNLEEAQAVKQTGKTKAVFAELFGRAVASK